MFPRLNPVRETGFSTRPRYTQLSQEEESQGCVGSKTSNGIVGMDGSDSGSINDPPDAGFKKLDQVLPSSYSDHFEAYLTDLLEGDSASEADQNMKQLNNSVLLLSPNYATDLAEENASLIVCNRVALGLEERVTDEEQNVGNWKCNPCSYVAPESKCKDPSFQNGRGGCGKEIEFSFAMPSECIHNAHMDEEYSENIESVSDEQVNSTMHEAEASQEHRGTTRRCLQFEEAQSSAVNTNRSLDRTSYTTHLRSAGTAEVPDCFHSHMTSNSGLLVNMFQPAPTNSHSGNHGKCATPVSKLSGIGLHLNSIVKSLPPASCATASMKIVDGRLSVQGLNLASITSFRSLENVNDSNFSSGDLSSSPEDRQLEAEASIASSSVISESLETTQHLNPTQTVDVHEMSRNKRMFIPESADSFEEFNTQSPLKKKKKSSSGNHDDGCKSCSCMKTKCMKLYCDCFAAGIYCDATCACQGCFNRPAYQETVLETRQQIESRNPLAFVPKVLQEEKNLLTPSARHKRGCSCKKSMCQKKYCECYQANVGCSSRCRCEGCKNIYGKNDGNETRELTTYVANCERSERGVDDRMKLVMPENSFSHAKVHNLRKMTPTASSFQPSDHGKGTPKSRLIVRRWRPSPGSDLPVASSFTKSPSSPRNSDKHVMTIKTGQEVSGVDSYDQGTGFSNSEMTGYFSSSVSSLDNTCHITQLSNRLSDGSKSLQQLDSETSFHDILKDETPEILKDASRPIKSVRLSSPSHKRVSPRDRHLHQLQSSSPVTLKSGRRFILRGVPSLTPLTPCTESKGLANQTTIDSQLYTSKQ